MSMVLRAGTGARCGRERRVLFGEGFADVSRFGGERRKEKTKTNNVRGK